MSGTLSRIFAAAPDAISAAVFLLAWVAPAIPGPRYVNDLVLVMLLQAFVIFAGVLYSQLVNDHSSRFSRASSLILMNAVMLLILIQVLHESAGTTDHSIPSGIVLDLNQIDRPEQLLMFVWLFASQFFHLLTNPLQGGGAEARRVETLSTLSVAAYVFSIVAAMALPLPPLGLTPEFVASLHRGDDYWGKLLYIVFAFGTFYFALQACIKFVLTGRPEPAVAAQAP